MDPFQLRSALKEVQMLRKAVLDNQRFQGYSGRARALGGVLAFVVGWGLQLFGNLSDAFIYWSWALVFLFAVLLNYGFVFYWSLSGKNKREPRRVRAIYEALPVWGVAGVLSVAYWESGSTHLLYPTWMLLFGLAQTMTRSVLPRDIVWVGAFYLFAGMVCLFCFDNLFRVPAVMGTVFLVGEFMGGIIFHCRGDWSKAIGIARIFGFKKVND